MPSWMIIFNLFLLLQASILEARVRRQSKRRNTFPTDPIYSGSMPSSDYFPVMSNGVIRRESATAIEHPANENQVEQFARLLMDRLKLPGPPNVTDDADDGASIPPSIVGQLKEQIQEEEAWHRAEEAYEFQQLDREASQPTTERALLPGYRTPYNTCQRQVASKFKVTDATLKSLGCFYFFKSFADSTSLPSDQAVSELRIYVKKTYFNLNNQPEGLLTPDMFQLYQTIRPLSNETSFPSSANFPDPQRLPISKIKQFTNDWFELTIEQKRGQNFTEQLYKQFLSPWYGLAISREVTKLERRNYQHYQSRQRFERLLRLNHDDGSKKSYDDQLPYMLVEYGNKRQSSLGRRSVRGTSRARPARGCEKSSPCCRRSLTIDLDQAGKALNFVIYPRKIDIGECVGLCGFSGSSLSHTDVKNAQAKNPQNNYNLLLLNTHNSMHNKSSASEIVSRLAGNKDYCCSYSRTGGIELMFRTSNTGPVIRRFIRNIIVEECRCGSSALI